MAQQVRIGFFRHHNYECKITVAIVPLWSFLPRVSYAGSGSKCPINDSTRSFPDRPEVLAGDWLKCVPLGASMMVSTCLVRIAWKAFAQ